MFKLHAVQAMFGDALILVYGTPSKPRHILIDGGPGTVFDKHLDGEIKNLVTTGKLDAIVVSHVDKDHIVGVLDLFAAMEEDIANGNKPRVKVGGLWHNSFQKTIDTDGEITSRLQTLMTAASLTSVAMPLTSDAFFGIAEGHRLRILAKQLKIDINENFKDDIILLETATNPMTFGNLSLRVVGPNQENLDNLRKDWLKWLKKQEKNVGSDLSEFANSDKSVPNLSSIVLLAECQGKTLLLTGDARGDHILDGLDKAKLLTNGKLHVDVLKVQHHGSNRNVTKTFFKKVTADRYVISADGKHDNPDLDTLVWIVEAAEAAKRKIEIIVTNATEATKKIKQTHPPATYGYKLTTMPKTDHSIEVVLA